MDSKRIPRHVPVWRDPRAVALLMAASLTTMANATISPALPGLERLAHAAYDWFARRLYRWNRRKGHW